MIKLITGIVALLFLLNGTAIARCTLDDFTLKKVKNKSGQKYSRKSDLFTGSTVSTSGTTTFGFATTSGTSGCGNNGSAYLQQEHFLLHNKVYLMADISRGSGEYLSSFSQLMGCSSEVKGQFAGTMQGQLDQLMPANPLPAKAMLTRIHRISAGDPVLSEGCLYTG